MRYLARLILPRLTRAIASVPILVQAFVVGALPVTVPVAVPVGILMAAHTAWAQNGAAPGSPRTEAPARARDKAAALPLPLPPPPPPPPRLPSSSSVPTLSPPSPSAGGVATPDQAGEEEEKPGPEGPKLPRFAALKADTVNLRAGPGTRYPIQWVYNRRELPVEIEREFEVWRAIRDPDGVRGWVHQATLTGRRTFVVKGADATVRSDRKDTASAVVILRTGVIGRLRACEAGSAWCEVRVGGHRGYLRRDQIWGLLPDEVVRP